MPTEPGYQPQLPLRAPAFLRLPDVLALIPVKKSTWWAGVKSGRYPPAVKLGPGVTVWRTTDIEALVADPDARPWLAGPPRTQPDQAGHK